MVPSKVLFFSSPWTEVERPAFKNAWQKAFFIPLANTLKKLNPECEIEIICGWAQKNYIEDNKLNHTYKKIHVIEDNNFDKSLELAVSLLKLNDSEFEQSACLNKIIDIVQGANSEIVFSFITPLNFLKAFCKDLLILTCEAGFSFRPPFAPNFYADKNGPFSLSHLFRQRDSIRNYRPTENELMQIRRFKSYFVELIHSKIPQNLRVAFSSIKYSRKLLVPLQFSNYFGWEGCVGFESQYSYLCFVLEHTPADTAVIPTEHHDYWPRFSEENKILISRKYPNCIWLDELTKFDSPSTLALPFVDGIIAVSSSVGYQSLIFDLPLFVCGKSHLLLFGSNFSRENLEKFFAESKKQCAEHILAYLLSRYFIPADSNYFFNANWMKLFLENIRAEGELYPKIGDLGEIVDHFVSSSLALEFPVKSSTHDLRLLEQIRKFDICEIDRLNLQTTLNEVRANEAKLENKIERLERRLTHIQNRLLKLINHFRNTKRHLISVLNSNSWKITKPFRLVFQFFRR